MRQVGKSTLATKIAEGNDFVRFNFDLISDQSDFCNQNRHDLSLFAEKYKNKLIIIDEIQKSPDATSIVKHLYDNFNMKFILTGSSEIKIRKNLGDSLAGRLHEVRLYPLSLEEINRQTGLTWDNGLEFNNFEENQKNLLKVLIYGSLPNLLNIESRNYEDYLRDYTNTIISKDVLEVAGTRKSTQVFLLAKLLALQIGQLINFNELSTNTEFSRESVYRYIDIFEQMGIIVRAKPISTNEREAISKATKIYFTDLGVRNSLVDNFGTFNNRLDKGQLLENAVFLGIKRQDAYNNIHSSLGFFRSSTNKEIDIVRKTGDVENLYEVKVTDNSKKKNLTIINFDNAQKYLY
jgi:predicted AAA+ superfamily ATPase